MDYDIEKILKLRDQLNEVTNQLNQKILEFESDLQKLQLGLYVAVRIKPSEHILGYQKFKDGWHIFITYKNREGEEITSKLIDAPRQLRLFGYNHRMLLLPALESAAESLIRRMSKSEETGN